MEKVIIFFFIGSMLTSSVQGQSSRIKFEESLTLDQIKSKAKNEGKYIFIDAFATWCLPCKKMDKEVFTNDSVAGYVNDKFISVRVQVDTSKNDDENIKRWYPDAARVREEYKIESLPSFLFFSPDGQIIHRGVAYKNPGEFIKLLDEALDSTKQYYSLLEGFISGRRDPDKLHKLAIASMEIGENKVAKEVAAVYIDNYLNKLNVPELCKKENLDFISYFPELLNSKDAFFNLFYNHPDEVDQITYTGCSERWVKYIINREEIEAKVELGEKLHKEPNWKVIQSTIAAKYNKSYADNLVLDAQLSYYRGKKSWKKFANLRREKIMRYPPKKGEGIGSDQWGLNIDAWDVFQYCNDKEVLQEALLWVEMAIKLEQPRPNMQYLDTKANILYKLGRKKEAISWEQMAIDSGIQLAKEMGRDKGFFYDEYSEVIKKMKEGQPTWPLEGN